jgi:glycosidase
MKKLLTFFVAVGLTTVALFTSGFAASAANPTFAMAKHPMIYFVMLDRFANGDPSNDSGNIPGGSTKSGFQPSETGFYHGGDLAGLTSKISYIKSLGFTAIWVTPVVRQVTVAPDGSSAGYHGYWGAGFDQVDPHLGTMQDFKDFVSAAHAQGLGVILDIVANHTGDVIYSSYGTMYSDTQYSPYLTKSGKPFDAAKLAGTSKFPKLNQLSATVSFPNPPLINSADEHVKSPAWLNDVRNYHNRGNSTFSGESSQYGDFYGLDDLFTESPVVVSGMAKVFADWIANTNIDGFRIDTARHVNKEFWRSFLPAMRKAAKAKGTAYFPMWGEVYDTDAYATSYWIKNASYNEVLDFPLQSKLIEYITSGYSGGLADVLNNDDLYSTANSNANQLVTFLGNHDMGRIGSFISQDTASKPQQLSEDQMAHALLFTLRGNPAVYYGDEFGLEGAGDQQARQDLFPTQVAQWKMQARIGGAPIGSASSFDTTNPLQDTLRALTALRASDAAFTEGPQIIRQAANGLFVFSRINPTTGAQYLCAFNAGGADANQTINLGSAVSGWTKQLGDGSVTASGTGAQIQLGAGKWGVFKAADNSVSPTATTVTLDAVKPNAMDSSQFMVQARVANATYQRVDFYRKTAKGAWVSLGSDNSPLYSSNTSASSKYVYRIFPLRSQFPAHFTSTVKAVVIGINGNVIGSTSRSVKVK